MSPAAIKKYVRMTADEVAKLEDIRPCSKRRTVMDDYLNIIFKMLRDRTRPEIIMSYVIRKGYGGSWATLENYIKVLAKNNFGDGLSRNWAYVCSYPDDCTAIGRSEILRYMTTKNPKTKKSEAVAENIGVIKERYPAVAFLGQAYDEFYDALMGDAPEKLDSFVDTYKQSVISGFIDGITMDLPSVKNAISYRESNGFVEGNNNKFKLIKRILYGRASLDTLFKKAYLAFRINSNDFNLSDLI